MKLNQLESTAGSRRDRKRLGTGVGSGQGKTAGRGHKGQTSRTGGTIRRGFEGGQMPLARRLPKRGFTSRNKKCYQLVNVGQLNAFDAGTKVDSAALFAAGLIRDSINPVKLLATGELSKKLEVSVATASASAKAKLEAAGATLNVVESK